MLKLCVADNNPITHQGIKSYLKESNDFNVLAYVNYLEDLYDLLDNKVIHIVVLDIELKGLTSINDISNLIKEFSHIKFFVFSNVSESLYANNALKIGVKGYLEKSASLKEFETAIKSVAMGNVFISKFLKTQNEKITKKSDRLFKKLSSREMEVLKYLASGKKNKEIAVILNIDEKTISTYKLRLLHKLSVTNLIDLINKAKSFDLI
ncbi:response regulator transcription factor [uncultured Flavobacterium sp.]|uniref:response regulator transcription factor n=1 Tax=uncultured Flavobacterium sp. TaxID=165435 RepID=UPI0030CA5AF3